jgi:2-oxoglutarate ferredoxin oxidoreductase subunit beta
MSDKTDGAAAVSGVADAAGAATAGAATAGATQPRTKPKVLFGRPHALTDAITNYCPGCTHGIITRLVAEVIDVLGIEGETIGVCPVGCSVMAYNFFNCDMAQAAHGRAPAVATGLKRARPETVVFTYQGDGDLASIGMAETVHAAARGENITVIFVNNAIYGMTGGQMAPTSLPGQVTQTSPYGRDVAVAGYPIKVCELLSSLSGVALAQRVTVDTPKSIRAAKRAIRKAFEYQMEGLGYTIIEVVATCPTNWGMSPQESFDWMRQNMLPYYPLGIYRDVKAEAGAGAVAADGSLVADLSAATEPATAGED